MLRGWTIEGRSHPNQRSTSSSRRFVLFCNVGLFSFRVRAISLCGLFFHQVFFSQLHDNTRTKKNKRISLWGEGWLDVFPSSPLSRGSLVPVFSSCSDASCSDGLPGCYDTPVFNWPCIGLIRLHSGQLRDFTRAEFCERVTCNFESCGKSREAPKTSCLDNTYSRLYLCKCLKSL